MAVAVPVGVPVCVAVPVVVGVCVGVEVWVGVRVGVSVAVVVGVATPVRNRNQVRALAPPGRGAGLPSLTGDVRLPLSAGGTEVLPPTVASVACARCVGIPVVPIKRDVTRKSISNHVVRLVMGTFSSARCPQPFMLP